MNSNEYPLFTYVEIFFGKDRLSPAFDEWSVVCIVSYEGTTFIFNPANPTAQATFDQFHFHVVGCSVYSPNQKKTMTGIETESQLTFNNIDQSINFVIKGTADVDTWNGWLQESEGKDY